MAIPACKFLMTPASRAEINHGNASLWRGFMGEVRYGTIQINGYSARSTVSLPAGAGNKKQREKRGRPEIFENGGLHSPRFCNAYNAMGNCLDEMGRYDEAMRKYEKVLELNPQHTEVRFKRAMIQKKIIYGEEVLRAGCYQRCSAALKTLFSGAPGNSIGMHQRLQERT